MWRYLFHRARPAAISPRPSPLLFFCLVGAFLLTILPHVGQLPLWVTIGIGAGMIVRSVGEVRRWPLPSSGFCGVLALCLLAGIYLQFDTVFGRDAGTAFMVALLAIKFFELRGARDVSLIIFSSFFVVMSSLLYSQVLELFVYCLIMMWILTALLLRNCMGDLPDNHLLGMLRGAGFIFLQAMPLTIFLFFFFPRYHGVLQLGMDDTSIGLTDKVKPGSISRLSDDDSTAMTVRFLGPATPSLDTMYWRALVLWHYARDAWTPGDAGDLVPRNNAGLPSPAPNSPTIDQKITIWPHFHRWLFALDYPVTPAEVVNGANGWSEALNGGVLQLSNGALTQKEQYTVTSALALGPQTLPGELREKALELPDAPDDFIDPAVRDLAVRLKKASTDENDYILTVLRFFRHGGFVYSDAPGSGVTLADFLLHSRRGFCEHYASAFAVLMRLAGYPARLVIGYEGAQYNPYKNIYVVKQSNAHSWDEVWIDSESQWRRVDPTSVLSQSDAPNLSSSSRNDDATHESITLNLGHHRMTIVSSENLPAWLRQGMLEMELRRQELEADWDDWVFSYDPQTQTRLAQALGFGPAAEYLLGLACLLVTGGCAVVLRNVMKRNRRLSPVERFYAQFCRTMAQRGVPRAVWEGPLAYTDRVAETFPERQRPIRDAGQIVARSRYSAAPPTADRNDLELLLLEITASGQARGKVSPLKR